MINTIKKLFGANGSSDLKKLIQEGAVILDVRSKGEYQQGHVKGSINIPLDTLASNLKKLDKNKPIITCCASGMRSGSAKGILQSHGFTNVVNGGGWHSVNQHKN
ncbi:MAG: rhodanese-like domain-containing protein [Bacteroidota bacterium]